ncbi:DMT family transporter [Hwanghaeella grinnelliae]|uniref:DMT family transporter n=1 Tax=Hwanghaeella grinnelliae TaxID=2500179 RepID=A0A437QTP9_9PROT|nr:DMT family transporter [Hwanghaeella grinnelliae]RVU37874.1 DMT family transporter [Hwanghaeella grinnelliae]
MTISNQSKDRPVRGIVLMMVSALFISGQEAIAKHLIGDGLPLSQVIWARYASHLALMLGFMLIFVLPRDGGSAFRSARPLAQVGRSMLLLIDTVLYFSALTFLSLVEVTAIMFIAPILVVLLARPLLGESLTARRLIAVAVGFSGVLIIVRPGFDGVSWPALLVIGAAVCVALFNLATRHMRSVDPSRVTMLYTALVGTVAASIWVPLEWVPPSLDQWGLMIAIGLLGGTAHGLLIVAHQDAPASTVAPFMYIQILWALGLGWMVFGDWPDIATAIGAAVIIAGGLIVLIGEARRNNRRSK